MLYQMFWSCSGECVTMRMMSIERQFPRDREGSEYSFGTAEKSMEMKSVIVLRKTYATDALTLWLQK